MVRRYTRRPITPTSNQGSILWTFLLLGLVFCVFDSIYLFYATHNLTLHPDGAGIEFVADQESETSETSPKKQVVNHQVHNQYDKQLSADSDLDSKERVIQIIKDADMESQLTPEIIEKLPTWKQVVDILGPAPRIFGLDSCQAFQDSLDPAEAFIAPAGAFNSGTNLMAELLIANCYNPARRKKYHTDGVRWQVNWGKHTPPKFREAHGVYKDKAFGDEMPNENILPVVTIRHPYSWMQSMCRNRYATHWFHEVNYHCPNLIPNHVEREFLPQALDGSYKSDRFDLHHKDPWLVDNIMNTANYTLASKTVPVYVKYKMETVNHESLAHMWNEWYRDYYDAPFPRVIVRYEDLLFYGKEVTEAACQCFGGKINRRGFRHIGESAKKGTIHMNKTSLVDNLIRFTQRVDNTKGMTIEDLDYARQVFAKDMMEFFAYDHPTVG